MSKLRPAASLAQDLSCRELVELVTAYLEGTMRPDERARVEAHLADCAGCRTYLVQMQQTIQQIGALAEHDLDPVTQAELMHLFQDWKQR